MDISNICVMVMISGNYGTQIFPGSGLQVCIHKKFSVSELSHTKLDGVNLQMFSVVTKSMELFVYITMHLRSKKNCIHHFTAPCLPFFSDQKSFYLV